jgi:hypothetical protein
MVDQIQAPGRSGAESSDDAMATWVVVSDDELVALAQSKQGRWLRPLETVDVASPAALAAGIARGYRSLLLRGLLQGDNLEGRALLLPLSLVDRQPGIMGTSVTPEFTQLPGAERFELFVDEAGQFVAVTTRSGGLHTFTTIDGQVGLSFFAELAVVHQAAADPSLDPFAILVRGLDGQLAGGFVIGEKTVRLGRSQAGFGPVEGPAVHGSVEAWTAEIASLLR